jgi:hypothetical protein
MVFGEKEVVSVPEDKVRLLKSAFSFAFFMIERVLVGVLFPVIMSGFPSLSKSPAEINLGEDPIGKLTKAARLDGPKDPDV